MGILIGAGASVPDVPREKKNLVPRITKLLHIQIYC